jgi:hypothetical protein
MQKDPSLAHSLHRLHSVNGQGHRLCNELDANQKRTAALVKACGLHKAPLFYGIEQLVAHLVINMTVLSRPALWQHAVVRRGLLDSAGLGGFVAEWVKSFFPKENKLLGGVGYCGEELVVGEKTGMIAARDMEMVSVHPAKEETF